MNLKDMSFIKLNRDKTPREKLSKSYTHSQVEFYADLGVLIQAPFVVLDVDDNTEFLKLKEIIKTKEIKCNIMKSTRGGHFWFKSPNPVTNNIHIKTPIGITVDVRSYGKLCYTKVKQEGEWRAWIDNVYDFDELDDLPFWLQPINHNYDLVDMKTGQGRNDKLFSYIIVLNNYMTKDRVRETFHIINDFILGDKLEYKELATILRDESFDNLRPNFFERSRFLFDKFAMWFINNHNVKRIDALLYIYDGKFYTSDIMFIEKQMLKHLPSLSRTQRMEVLEYLRLMAPVAKPSEFYYVIFNNCIVDVRDLKMHEYSSDFFIPQVIDTEYNPNITSHEAVDNFMNRVCVGDQEVIKLMYEMIGYMMLATSKYQKAFILYGDGSNGKSTFLDMVIHVLGDRNISSLSLKEINHAFKLAEITDKLANIGDDISDEYITDSSTFKKLVTGEDITVEKKHQHPYRIRNTATLIFATNNLPNMQDKSNGMVRRLCIVPFNAIITRDDPDFNPFIIDEVTTPEAKSYIVNRAFEGLKRVFMNQGFTEPQLVKDLMDDYYKEINNVIQFIESIDIKSIVGKASDTLYNDYVFWCINNNQNPYKLRRFNTEIRKRTDYDLKQRRKNGEVKQVWA